MQPFARQLDHAPVRIPASGLPPPVVSYVGGRTWRLEEDYVYEHGPHTITVPHGFQFDLSSVPRFLWWLIAPFELSIVAPLLHDFLYRHAGSPPEGTIEPPRTYTRQQADDLFRTIMEQEDVPAWRRRLAYVAVRIFGRLGWGRS